MNDKLEPIGEYIGETLVALAGTIERVAKGFERPGDFKDKENIVHCGECKEAKQAFVELFGKNFLVPVACRCARQEQVAKKSEEEMAEKRQRIERMRRKGITDPLYDSMTFDGDDKKSKAMKYIRQYYQKWAEVRAENIGLLLWGGVGTGKTYAAASLANALLADGVPVLMTNFGRIANQMGAIPLGDPNNTKEHYLARLNDFALLIIDDLGMERTAKNDDGASWMTEIAYSVIDNRYKAKKPIVVTTNMEPDGMAGETRLAYRRIYDRLQEMCVPIKFEGESRRQTTGTKKASELRALFGEE